MSLIEAHEAPVSLLLQMDALIDAWDRVEDRRALVAANAKAMAEAVRGRNG